MTTSTNPLPRVLEGTFATRPSATGGEVHIGDVYVCSNKGNAVYVVEGDPAVPSAWQWVQVGGEGGSFSSKYWVNVSGSIPDLGYTSIQDAIDAAVTDGHDASDPATIFVYPGTYNESVIIYDGIWIQGVRDGGQPFGSASLMGLPEITDGVIVNAACTTGGISNMTVSADGKGAVAFGAGAFSYFRIEGCTLTKTGGGAVITAAPTQGATARLHIFDSYISNGTAQGGIAGLQFTAGVFCVIQRTAIGGTSSDTAISVAGASVFLVHDCDITGSISNVSGAGNWSFSDTRLLVGGQPYISAAAGAPTFAWANGLMSGGFASASFAGTFTFTRSGTLICDANGLIFPSTITFNVTRTLGHSLTVNNVGAGNLTAANVFIADVHTLDTTAGGRSVALPAANTYPAGIPVTFAVKNGANAITVTPNGTDTINGVNAAMATSASLRGNMTLMRESGTSNWICLSVF